jgi:hypothetical protein
MGNHNLKDIQFYLRIINKNQSDYHKCKSKDNATYKLPLGLT